LPYNLKSFISKVPRNDFKECITTKFPDVEFDDKYLSIGKNDKFELGDRKYGDYITKLIQGLDAKQQLSINHDCELSYIITQDDTAIKALDDALEVNQDAISEGFNLERQSPESKALIVQIKHPEIIDLAVKYYSLDKYSNGTKHSQYCIEDGFEFKHDEETKKLFEKAINESVNKKNIIKLKTKADWIERTLENGEKVQQIIFYREKPPSAVQKFNEDEIETDFLLIVSEGAISFNPKTGSIYIAGEGGKDFHDSIKENFQEIVLEQPEDKEQEIKKIEPKNINFEVFNTKPDFAPHYNGYFKSVEVESIKLLKTGQKKYITIEDKHDDKRDAYQELSKLSKFYEDISKTPYSISKVGIRCVIQKNETDDEEIISFDLTHPNRSNLPNQYSIHQKPIEELLKNMTIFEK
jgi:hypothetical protein